MAINELIKVNIDEKQDPTISGRELHEFLEVGTQYTKWFERMCEYGFIENQDFSPISQKRLTAQKNETTFTDHAMKIDMAKEIAMIQRSEKGKQARQYFLSIEKEWNSPAKVMARALIMANSSVLRLEAQIETDRPKVIFADAVSVSKSCILIGDLAKIIKQNGIDVGQKRLFEWMRENGYLIKRQGFEYNSPTQKAMELGLFEVKETSVSHSDGHVTISKTTKVTAKAQIYFVNKFLNKLKG